MNKIEAEIHAHFAEASSRGDGNAAADAAAAPAASSSSEEAPDTPFANVNSVFPGSPADVAGMLAGDHIVRFGTVNWLNHDKLAKVAEVVSQNEGVMPTMPTVICLVLTVTAPDSSDGQTRFRLGIIRDETTHPHPTAKLGRKGSSGLPSAAHVVCSRSITDRSARRTCECCMNA